MYKEYTDHKFIKIFCNANTGLKESPALLKQSWNDKTSLERQNSLGTCLCLNVCLLTNFIDANEPPNWSRLDRPLIIVLLNTIKIFCHASIGLKESQHYLNNPGTTKQPRNMPVFMCALIDKLYC